MERILSAVLVLAMSRLAAAQTAHQGSPTPEADSDKVVHFKSPMVIETIFLPADRSLWAKRWFSTYEYARLLRFKCDLVYIAGLSMSAKEQPEGQASISVKFSLVNPNGGDDKKVTLLFEVLNGDEIAGKFDLPATKVKEGSAVTKILTTSLPLTALKTDPMTKLRITMTDWNY